MYLDERQKPYAEQKKSHTKDLWSYLKQAKLTYGCINQIGGCLGYKVRDWFCKGHQKTMWGWQKCSVSYLDGGYTGVYTCQVKLNT